jgi:two-component system alkaline phosphatase synthesis response regulator PhoP
MIMYSILIIAKDIETTRKLQSELSSLGFDCLTARPQEKVVERIAREAPELILLKIDGPVSQLTLNEIIKSNRIKRKATVLALIQADMLDHPEDYQKADDFFVYPGDIRELAARARMLVKKNNNQAEILDCGELVIDLANCEVRVLGKIVELTFKEFELLKFLASESGRVFSREALLNKVWGYDYFGGDRTVDVHVRRLRSKIELSGHTFIETVRNIGYRFKKAD